mmetsp:Transcript_6504/g.13332  ORF Transcript_6504/g.13332 Transcript_6504/m.13332 type:complete len:437 (-) Transcript_6504:1143-2453(-)|eukprot:CAMPEP_0171349118 /NCGR_PEP_ID=MMETSP0878-20121228/32783_1 /TAXON_ID=67004 /ORGANISM="Thalassiosira weissflogii, Strain CCMP1336" /LENGTH=436 /DNA_ID=CAMNT_0011853669 /DNA_START=1127 /DNA_END=2437 /DNA_ORIENTATION=+
MSYRELRKFTETLRRLNYPQSISIESFRTPNFELMAEVLYWMVQRLDPSIPIHDDINTEDDRVEFLNGITTEVAAKSHINLNARNLYVADGNSVKELLILAQFLHRASILAEIEAEPDETFNVENNVESYKKSRSLATEITEIGARLHESLNTESDDKKERSKAIKFLKSVTGLSVEGSEKDHIESSIIHILDSTRDEVERLDKQCRILLSNEKGTEEKIRKKSVDLERNSKRLESLKGVRPAFMDEYEQLEIELKSEYDRYVVRFRNVDYLEEELLSYDELNNEKHDDVERNAKKMQKKFRAEELRILEEGAQIESDEEENDRSITVDHRKACAYETGAAHLDKSEDVESPQRSAKERERKCGEDRIDNTMNLSVDDASNSDCNASSSSMTTPRDCDSSFSSRDDGNHSNFFDQADSNSDSSSSVSVDTGSYNDF